MLELLRDLDGVLDRVDDLPRLLPKLRHFLNLPMTGSGHAHTGFVRRMVVAAWRRGRRGRGMAEC